MLKQKTLAPGVQRVICYYRQNPIMDRGQGSPLLQGSRSKRFKEKVLKIRLLEGEEGAVCVFFCAVSHDGKQSAFNTC